MLGFSEAGGDVWVMFVHDKCKSKCPFKAVSWWKKALERSGVRYVSHFSPLASHFY